MKSAAALSNWSEYALFSRAPSAHSLDAAATLPSEGAWVAEPAIIDLSMRLSRALAAAKQAFLLREPYLGENAGRLISQVSELLDPEEWEGNSAPSAQATDTLAFVLATLRDFPSPSLSINRAGNLLATFWHENSVTTVEGHADRSVTWRRVVESDGSVDAFERTQPVDEFSLESAA